MPTPPEVPVGTQKEDTSEPSYSCCQRRDTVLTLVLSLEKQFVQTKKPGFSKKITQNGFFQGNCQYIEVALFRAFKDSV